MKYITGPRAVSHEFPASGERLIQTFDSVSDFNGRKAIPVES
jgi:hypothetical protein